MVLDPVTFFIEGDPVPKQSFRVVTKGEGDNVKIGGYRSPKVTKWQNTIGYRAKEFINQHGHGEKFPGLVKVSLTFYLSTARRVDLDNLSKSVLDALNKILWQDDSAVVELQITKIVRSDNPGVRISVSSIPDNMKTVYVLKGK